MTSLPSLDGCCVFYVMMASFVSASLLSCWLWLSTDDSLQTASHLFQDKTQPADADDGGGWGGDDDWGDFDKSASSAPAASSPPSRSQQTSELTKEQKREERRLRQQAAKEKRAAGQANKRVGLGAVKKVD